MKSFYEWKNLFSKQNLYEFNLDETGVVWLKLKSINRKDILESFLNDNNMELKSLKQEDKIQELYKLYLDNKLSEESIDSFLKSYNSIELHETAINFEKIKNDLYKVKEFIWGGDASNSLDKQIVSIVKKTSSYDTICKKIESDISISAYHYTLCSWYNNWSTILTEHIFKSCNNVLSAVGKIKSVDFFVDNIPIDLKITYFPKLFLDKKRKDKNLKTELSILKKLAKKNAISVDEKLNDDTLKYQLKEQLKDLNNKEVAAELQNIYKQNDLIINETINNKNELIKWLYENQGEMRFGSENRIFLVLINKNNLSDSWKLKRNFTLQKEHILNYMENFNANNFKKNVVNFSYKGKQYNTLSDIIFIIS